MAEKEPFLCPRKLLDCLKFKTLKWSPVKGLHSGRLHHCLQMLDLDGGGGQ
jgi:hypothetical protein